MTAALTMSSKSLDQWLAYIEACHPEEIDLGLERIKKVARVLDLTSLNCPVITVAGTNGKGSTIAYMAEILSQDGYQAGCYTSPHFLRYNERVVINGQSVDDQLLCQSFERIENARERAAVALTYFEYGTLAALDIFNRAALDVVLLEVGLGGRLDAVNIIDPDISVVTTIAIDHESWLGCDRETIGYEKAGIYRSNSPAVYGERDMPDSVAEYAHSIGASLFKWGDQFAPTVSGQSWTWQGVDAQGSALTIDKIPHPGLPFENAATAIQALMLLGLPLKAESIRDGVTTAGLTGRCQRLSVEGREVILDVAHNPHAAEHLVKSLRSTNTRFHCVLGMLADKDIAGTLEQLKLLVNHWYPATLKVPRGQNSEELQQALVIAGIEADNISTADSVIDSFKQAVASTDSGDTILVVGSFFTVAQILDYFGDQV